MSTIDTVMLAEVFADIEEEKGHPNKYSVHIQEIFLRLEEKGYRVSPDLSEAGLGHC